MSEKITILLDDDEKSDLLQEFLEQHEYEYTCGETHEWAGPYKLYFDEFVVMNGDEELERFLSENNM